ncbi:MAG: substrate-binding domain-containing protein [Xanthobacteraceae bacterium]
MNLVRVLSLAVCLSGFLNGCGPTPITTFTIVSGSENRTLEPIVQAFCKEQKIACTFEYMGSLDIGMAVAENRGAFDAVWPANSVWIDLFDHNKRVVDLTSIMRSPVILGVRTGKAKELGWIDRAVSSRDIDEAVRGKRLTYLASSATQSNSGASAYITMLSAALGSPTTITLADLERPDVRDKVRSLLSGISRTAGSSAWLSDLYLKGLSQGVQYDAMWNYEAVLAETNQILKDRNQELLYAIYPSDGMAIANSPLGFVDRGRGPSALKFFKALQAHLLSPDVQQRLVESFRRPAVGEVTGVKPDPSWNYDPARLIKLIRMPDPAVMRTALDLYQDALRRPSLTVYCLDFSSDMRGQGEKAMRQAMNFILSRDQAAPLLVQHAAADRIVVIPFDSTTREVVRGSGTQADQTRLLDVVKAQQASGGSDFYACAERGLEEVLSTPNSLSYLPAIIVMTNGKSDDRLQEFLIRWRASHRDIPIFGITFGDGDPTQLARLTEATRGRVFDGTTSLTEAFRTVRGYN